MTLSRQNHLFLALSLLLLGPIGAAGQESTWDRAANVRSAAASIANVQKQKGANGASAAIKVCYDKVVKPAQSYSREVEACLTQDVINSRVSAAVYSSVSKEALKMSGSPSPKAVLDAMSARVVQTFARLKVPPEEARQIFEDIKQVGEPAFMRARFPSR